MKNNISDLAPIQKNDFQKILEFENWMREKVRNIHVGKNKRMCRAYEIITSKF